MLRAGAGGVTPELVARASLWSCLKSGFTTVAMLLLLVLSGVALGRWFSAARRRES